MKNSDSPFSASQYGPIFLLIALLVMLSFPKLSVAQGCMPAKHIPPNLGTNGLSYLMNGQWETGVSYRYLKSNTAYRGAKPWDQINEAGTGPDMTGHSLNFAARYSLNTRWSFSLNVPITYVEQNSLYPDGIRHTVYPGAQLGDIRINANYWLFDPMVPKKGNVAFGFGVKAPTANEALKGPWYTPNGVQTRDYDIGLQPGDGGWGLIMDVYWFHKWIEGFSTYFSGFYLANPRNTNTSEPPQSNPSNRFFASVPDQFGLQGGVNVGLGKFSLRSGLRYDGMPVNDLIGKSDGFRRPGDLLYFDPGIMWSDLINTLNFSLPIALYRNIKTSNLHRRLGVQTGGGLADFLIIIGYTRRF